MLSDFGKLSVLVFGAGLAVSPLLAQTVVQRVPQDMDSSNQSAWFQPLVVQGNTTYVALNTPGDTAGTHYVKVGVQVNGGTWQFDYIKNADGTLWTQIDDLGHNQPSMVIDGSGYIHVWADHHRNDWRYFRSATPNSVTNISRIANRTPTGFPDQASLTYIVPASAPNGDLYMIARDTSVISGSGVGNFYRWNKNSRVWTKVATFASQSGQFVYPDDVKVDAAGRVHIVWEWRSGGTGALRHQGSYLRFDPATGVFRTVNGQATAIPVNLSTPNLLFQPLEAGEVSAGSDEGPGIQSAAVAIDGSNRPSLAWRYRSATSNGFDAYRMRSSGSTWVDKVKVYTATKANGTNASIDTTHNGTRVRVYLPVSGLGVIALDKADGWIPHQITPGKAISRTIVYPLDDNTDIVYGAAPTDIDANTGSLYIVEVGPVLP